MENETTSTKSKSLTSKLAEVMAAIERVPKLGRNEFFRYNYATEADLTAAVRPLLAERGIIMIPHVKTAVRHEHTTPKGNKGYLTDVEINWIIRDGETGESITFTMPGCGEDSGDKGLYKAITGSEKYALKNLFLIPTGDDPEKDDSHPDPKTAKPDPEMRKLVREASLSAQEYALKNLPTGEQLPKPWQPGEAGPKGTQSFIGVLEEVVQKPDEHENIWTSGFIDGKRFFTKDMSLGTEMLRFLDCDCEVTARPGKKPNDYQLLSIK